MVQDDPRARRHRAVWAVTTGVGAMMCTTSWVLVGGYGWVMMNLPIDQGQWLGAAYGVSCAVGPVVAGWSGIRAIREGAGWMRAAGVVLVLLALVGLAWAVGIGAFLFTWEGFQFTF